MSATFLFDMAMIVLFPIMGRALATIGLNTSFASMKKAGIRPMIHGFIISALVVIVALLVEMGMGIV